MLPCNLCRTLTEESDLTGGVCSVCSPWWPSVKSKVELTPAWQKDAEECKFSDDIMSIEEFNHLSKNVVPVVPLCGCRIGVVGSIGLVGERIQRETHGTIGRVVDLEVLVIGGSFGVFAEEQRAVLCCGK